MAIRFTNGNEIPNPITKTTAMSKQLQAKLNQGYQLKPVLPVCSNCTHFKSDLIPSEWNNDYIQEKNLRCGIGGFAVKKQSTCREYKTNTPQL